MFWGDDQQQTGSASGQIAVLLERLKTATLVADRRDAVEGLKDLAESNQGAMGKLGMGVLLETLREEPRDEDIVSTVLDILVEIIHLVEMMSNLEMSNLEMINLEMISIIILITINNLINNSTLTIINNSIDNSITINNSIETRCLDLHHSTIFRTITHPTICIETTSS